MSTVHTNELKTVDGTKSVQVADILAVESGVDGSGCTWVKYSDGRSEYHGEIVNTGTIVWEGTAPNQYATLFDNATGFPAGLFISTPVDFSTVTDELISSRAARLALSDLSAVGIGEVYIASTYTNPPSDASGIRYSINIKGRWK